MHVGFKLLQLLFVHHAKMLLFIHNHQAKIAEFNLLTEQCVGANNNVNLSRCQTVPRFLHVF